MLLDPPYSAPRTSDLYTHDGLATQAVSRWCLEHGTDPKLRIVLCGYEGEHDLPGWTVIPWKAQGGYGHQAQATANLNHHKERLWLSPNCITPTETTPCP